MYDTFRTTVGFRDTIISRRFLQRDSRRHQTQHKENASSELYIGYQISRIETFMRESRRFAKKTIYSNDVFKINKAA